MKGVPRRARVVLRARGPLPAGQAWERYAEPARWPTWSPHLRSVEVPEPRLRAGLRGRVRGIVGPAVPFEVLTYDEAARRWSWRVGPAPLGVRLAHEVSPALDGGSLTRLVMSAPLPLAPLLATYAPLAKVALRRLVR